MKRMILAGTLLPIMAYAALQLWVAGHPPIRVFGWSEVPTELGQQVVLGVAVVRVGGLSPHAVSVSTDQRRFVIQEACALEMTPEHSEGFLGVAAPALPQRLQDECTPLSEVAWSPRASYSIAMRGKVAGDPAEGTVGLTLTYRFLGWPHKIAFAGRLITPASK